MGVQNPKQFSFDDFYSGGHQSSDILDAFRNGHILIEQTLNMIREYGIGSEEGRESFFSIESHLFEHIRRVNEELYPLLQNITDENEEIKCGLDAIIKDSVDISNRARRLYNVFTPDNPDFNALGDFVAFVNALYNRLQLERKLLFGIDSSNKGIFHP